MANAQSARRELLGLTLRRYREAAAIIGGDASKIGRIESGARGVRAFELAGLLTGYGVSGPVREVLTLLGRPDRDCSWRADFGFLLPAPWLDLAAAESVAVGICAYGRSCESRGACEHARRRRDRARYGDCTRHAGRRVGAPVAVGPRGPGASDLAVQPR